MTEKECYEYFNYLLKLVHTLNKKQYEELETFLGDMEQSIDGGTTLKEIEKYIKKYKSKNKILFITFKTKNKNKLAHICKYVIDLEWNKMKEKTADEIEIENERDKNLYMQGYEQALKDANVNKFFQEGYIYGIQIENKNFIRNLEEVIYELKEKRKKGNIVIGYWQIKNMIEEIIKQCKIN